MKKSTRILNDEIRAHKVRLIDEQWEILGDMTLPEARLKASEQALDLMQLSQEWDTTIVKMLDYGKFLYKQKKLDQKNKQKSKSPDLKTIKITFKIWEHDLEVKKNQAIKFAKDKHPLKLMLTLRGRENHYEGIAREKIQTFITMIEDYYKLDKNIAKNGNNFIVMLSPK